MAAYNPDEDQMIAYLPADRPRLADAIAALFTADLTGPNEAIKADLAPYVEGLCKLHQVVVNAAQQAPLSTPPVAWDKYLVQWDAIEEELYTPTDDRKLDNLSDVCSHGVKVFADCVLFLHAAQLAFGEWLVDFSALQSNLPDYAGPGFLTHSFLPLFTLIPRLDMFLRPSTTSSPKKRKTDE